MTNGHRLNLLEDADATGSAKSWPGGKGAFITEATWGGGTVKLQLKSPNGTWIDFPSASHEANDVSILEVPPGEVRAHVATAEAIFAYLVAL